MTVIGGVILAVILYIPKYVLSKSNISSEQKHPQATAKLTVNIRQSVLRSLEPLETGKKISELPNNVYFYASPLAIQYEVDDPKNDFVKATNVDKSYYFELQKIESRYYVIDFVTDEVYSNIGSIKERSIYTILFPNAWGVNTHPIAIPIDAIQSINTRTLDLDEQKSIEILDIGFKEVVDRPTVHKIKTL